MSFVMFIVSFVPLSFVISIVPPVRSRLSPYLYSVFVGSVFIFISLYPSSTVIPNVLLIPLYDTFTIFAPTVVVSNPVIVTSVFVIGIAGDAIPLAITGVTFPPVKSIFSFTLYISLFGFVSFMSFI